MFFNIKLDFIANNMCVDLNGLIYVCDYRNILILDPRKNYRQVQTLEANSGLTFHRFCVDDKNRLIATDNLKKQINIFD